MKMPVVFCIALLYLAFVSVSAPAQCPTNRTRAKITLNGSLKYRLDPDTRFNIKLANGLNSKTYQTGEVVKFTVLENVYGYYVKKHVKETDPKTAGSTSPASAPAVTAQPAETPKLLVKKGDMEVDEMMIVIPVNTQGFGRINYSKPRSTLYVKGKAKIFFAPEYVLTDDGRCFEVRLNAYGKNDKPENLAKDAEKKRNEKLFPPKNIQNCKYLLPNVVRPAGAVTTEKGKIKGDLIDDKEKANRYYDQCVAGRREQILIGKGIVGTLAATGLSITVSKVKTGIPALTLAQTASSDDGIGALLSGSEAEIHENAIFEVEISNESDQTGYIKGKPSVPDEEAESEPEKPKKDKNQ